MSLVRAIPCQTTIKVMQLLLSASPLDRHHSEKGQRPKMIVLGSWRCVRLGWHVYKWISPRRESQNYRKSTKQISKSSHHKREYLCRNDTADKCRVTISNWSHQVNPFNSLQIPQDSVAEVHVQGKENTNISHLRHCVKLNGPSDQ